jgi:hypothetical protein
MSKIGRRPALALGLVAAATPMMTGNVAAQMRNATEGNEVAPGVKEVPLGKGASMLPGYKRCRRSTSSSSRAPMCPKM